MGNDPVGREQQFCTFYVGEACYGIEVKKVNETLRDQAITPVPMAPPAVRGIINVRGDILTAIDLGTLLGSGEREAASTSEMHVIADVGEGRVSFIVDRIGDVISATQEQYEPPPATLDGIAKELILGAYTLDDRLLLVLDSHRAAEI